MHAQVIVVEDEIHSGTMLSKMIGRLRPAWDVKATLQSVADTVAYLQSNPKPDIIF